LKQHCKFIVLIICVVLLAFPATTHAQIPNPGDWVDDLTQDIQFMVDGLWYKLLLLHATIQWFLMKLVIICGIIIDLVTTFIAEQAFAPLITQSNSQFGIAVSMSFTIAMIVLGLSYMVAHFIRLNVVEFKSAFMWYVLVALFFQMGPELYLGMNSLRSDINSFFYATSLQTINNSGSPLAPLNSNLSDDGIPMLPPCDNFGWLTGSDGVDGLDIAMAYMLATSRDVLGNPPPTVGNCTTANPGGYDTNLPFRWYHTDGYFDRTVSPPTWNFIPADDRERALSMAAAAQYRIIGAWPLLWLGLFEKIVYLLVTFAQGLSFVSFGVAAIFAFFKRTEAIARSVVDLWIEIIVTSVVIALGQSLVVSLAIAAAATQNPLASIGVGLLCAVLMFILMFAGIKLVWNALTRIFGAISQATGGAIMTPQQMATGAAVGTVGMVAAVATGGGTLALAGAAMAGMGASGIGGPGMSMAGGQLMMAGRMSGGRRMTPTDSSSSTGRSRPMLAVQSSTDASIENTSTYSGRASLSSPNSPAAQPVTMRGYDAESIAADSPIGRRTSQIEGRFTPLEQSKGRLHSALASDSLRDDAATQARLDADNVRDDAALRSSLNASNDGQRAGIDTTGLERAGRELSAAANALKATAQQQHMDQVMGRMDVTGQRNVGAVVADAVDMERDYRKKMNKPMLDGAGETFGGRIAQAVGVEPVAGQPPISDPARFNALGDGALRLGLKGGHVMQVLHEQATSDDGRSITPNTQERLVQHVRVTTGARQSEAEQQVRQFVNVAAAMPQEVRVTGSVPRERIEKPEGAQG